MADQSFVLPYQDPYDPPLPPNIFNLGNPTLADLSHEGPVAFSSSLPQQPPIENGFLEGNDPFLDPMIQDHFVHNHFSNNGAGNNNFEAGPSELHGESSHHNPGNENFGSQNFNDVVPLSCWPEPPVPFMCSCCFVLREIVHTNGINFSKLEIHGRLGLICHAIQYQNITADSSAPPQYQMFDYCKRSIEEIKHHIVQYCLRQNSAGYCIVQDPMSAYYEALCIGLDWTEDLYDDLVDLNPNISGGISTDDMEQDAEAEGDTGRIPRSLAAQRERAGRMRLSDLSNYFHLPIDEAAKQVNLCPTVVKKICRKEGLARWPHRKVKSIIKQISVLRRTLATEDLVARSRTQAEINRLEQEMIQHCGGVAPTSLNFE